jgi:type I restriction enzyme S subunit
MIDLKPYPEYKDSGVPWLGKVPGHWQVRQLGRLGTLSKGNGGNKEDEIADGVPCIRYGDLYTQHGFFIERSRACVSPERTSSYTPIRYGDVLFAASGETIEEIGKSAVNLMTTPAVCGGDVLRFTPAVPVNPRFIGYACDGPQATVQKSLMGRGFTVMHIYGTQLKSLWVPLPPLPEQAALARFLDHADRRIRRYVGAKQKLIKLLEEQKRAIIRRAVTRGLDPNVRLKPSGVEWLGDVPEHWVVASLRFRYHQCLGKMVDAKRETGKYPIPYLRNVDVQWDRINTADLPQIDIAPGERERYTVRSGDLLVCEGRHLGRAAFWRGDFSPCAFQKALHRLRARNPRIDAPRWLFYCLYVVYFQDAFGASSHDNSIPHLTGEMLRAHKFPFPSFDEQTLIAAYIDEKVAAIDQARALITCEIERVLEYRTRLIADLITGKLDVREAAAGLPDESDELEPLDEAEPDMEYVAADHLDTVPEEAEA